MSQVSNSHRISWIDAQIRAGSYPNATTIAEHFEISRRQAARDVEYLRYSMGAPIAYSSTHNGYHYTDDTYVLPALVVTDAERSTLGYLAERYASLEDETAARVAGVLRRLGMHAVDDGATAPFVAIDAAELDAVGVVRRAVAQRVKVMVRYRGADGVVVGRTIWPYAVVTRFGTLSCVGYCEEIGYTHVFPLFRFERVERTTTTFDVPAHVHAGDWTRDVVPPTPFVAVVRLHDAADAERLERAVALDDGTFRVEFYDAGSIIAALLSCPSPVEVLSPRWLRSRLAQRLHSLLALNDPSAPG